MQNSTSISFDEAGTLNTLVSDYLKGKDSLKKFHKGSPSLESFSTELKSNLYKNLDRKALSGILKTQARTVSNTSEQTLANIDALEKETAYTITTGHQLCLFTGPLYFIYKIFSVINLCDELRKKYSGYQFVPVYWAASEDHDFEEVNHFHAFGKKITWNSGQKGAVGDFKTAELAGLTSEIKSLFGESSHGSELISLFENSYLKHNNLADATRFLVNELFGEYGLVTVDGNNREFKKQFAGEFRSDIFENKAYVAVTETAQELAKEGYHVQVNPREINCFFLEENKRARIEKVDNRFSLVNEERTFSEGEMKSLVELHPEKISPNVVLRPLYQQTILPNLAYVGGPGELAYWLEYKRMFDASGKNFPLLMMRASLTLIDENTASKIEKLNLNIAEFFKEENTIVKKYLAGKNQVFDTQQKSEQMSGIFLELEKEVASIDKTLAATVKAELQKSLNSLQMIEGKVNRALKSQSDTELKQINAIKEKFYPDGILQERHDNFSMFYIRHGKNFLRSVKNNINVFDESHKVVFPG